MMKIGAMRHRIEIQRKLLGITENGFAADTSETVDTVWAEVKQVSSRERRDSDTTQAETRHLFRIRQLPSLTTAMEIIFHEERYQIVSIDYLRYEKQYVEIVAERIKQSG